MQSCGENFALNDAVMNDADDVGRWRYNSDRCLLIQIVQHLKKVRQQWLLLLRCSMNRSSSAEMK